MDQQFPESCDVEAFSIEDPNSNSIDDFEYKRCKRNNGQKAVSQFLSNTSNSRQRLGSNDKIAFEDYC